MTPANSNPSFSGSADGCSSTRSSLGDKLRFGFDWIIEATALLLPMRTAASDLVINFDDGNTHTIADDAYRDYEIRVSNGSTLKIEKGAVIGGDKFSSGHVKVFDSSSLIINDGQFGATGDYSGEVTLYGSSTLIINGGTFGSSGSPSGRVTGSGASRLTINGGTFGGDGRDSGLLWGSYKSVTIIGGIFGGAGYRSGAVVITSGATINISGGTFGGTGGVSGALFLSDDVTIEAETFDTSVYCRNGGSLGVTFCDKSESNIEILVLETGAKIEMVQACTFDADGDGVLSAYDQWRDSLEVADTIHMNGLDTAVANILFEDGCTLSDRLAALAASAPSQGHFVSSVVHLTNELKKQGLLSEAAAEAIKLAASTKP